MWRYAIHESSSEVVKGNPLNIPVSRCCWVDFFATQLDEMRFVQWSSAPHDCKRMFRPREQIQKIIGAGKECCLQNLPVLDRFQWPLDGQMVKTFGTCNWLVLCPTLCDSHCHQSWTPPAFVLGRKLTPRIWRKAVAVAWHYSINILWKGLFIHRYCCFYSRCAGNEAALHFSLWFHDLFFSQPR